MLMKVKIGTTHANVIAIILIAIVNNMSIAFVNAQVVLLLSEPDYFNVPKS